MCASLSGPSLIKIYSFFNSLQRISQDNYRPSIEDISRASYTIHEDQDVIIPKKSAGKCHNYRFIDAVNAEAERSNWVYSSSEVSMVIQIVDAAALNIPRNGTESTNGFEEDLVLLQQICSSRWLSGTPVLVVLTNSKEMIEKFQDLDVRVYFPAYSGDRVHVEEFKSYIRDLFLCVEMRYDMKIWVEYLDGGASAKTGKTAIGIIDKILTEQSVLNYGLV